MADGEMDNAAAVDDVSIVEESARHLFEKPTVPSTVTVSFDEGLDDEFRLLLGRTVVEYLAAFSRDIDLTSLDGITIALDYDQALHNLDRGYETAYKLRATNDEAIGVAMTPAVLRDGKVKSHIVFNADYVWSLGDRDNEFWSKTVHLVAHEAAHVEVTDAFDRCFPGVLLRPREAGLGSKFLDQIVKACWEEYAVCRICSPYGEDPTQGYIDIFLTKLPWARQRANAAIREYRTTGDNDAVLTAMVDHYGNLMKFASYLLGQLDGSSRSPEDFPEIQDAMQGHWFAPFLDRLHSELKSLWANFGNWQDEEEFEGLSRVARDTIASGGVIIESQPGNRTKLDIPFTRETMPEYLGPLLANYPPQ